MAFRTIRLEKFLTSLAGWLDRLDTDIFNDLNIMRGDGGGESVRVGPNIEETENKLRKNV